MPTSLSQEADGQLKNKDTVSIGHSKEKFASISVHAIANVKEKKIPNTKTTLKTEGRKMLPVSHDLMVLSPPRLFRAVFMGQDTSYHRSICPRGGGHLKLGIHALFSPQVLGSAASMT